MYEFCRFLFIYDFIIGNCVLELIMIVCIHLTARAWAAVYMFLVERVGWGGEQAEWYPRHMPHHWSLLYGLYGRARCRCCSMSVWPVFQPRTPYITIHDETSKFAVACVLRTYIIVLLSAKWSEII